MIGPVTSQFAAASAQSMQDMTELCGQILLEDIPVLREMMTLWHDSIEHGPYVRLCRERMDRLRGDLSGRMTVGRLIDLVDDEHRWAEMIQFDLENFSIISDTLKETAFRNQTIAACLKFDARDAGEIFSRRSTARMDSVETALGQWRRSMAWMDDALEDLETWQKATLINDAKGRYGAYNTGLDDSPALQLLMQERDGHLLAVSRLYVEGSMIMEDAMMALTELHDLYTGLLERFRVDLGGDCLSAHPAAAKPDL